MEERERGISIKHVGIPVTRSILSAALEGRLSKDDIGATLIVANTDEIKSIRNALNSIEIDKKVNVIMVDSLGHLEPDNSFEINGTKWRPIENKKSNTGIPRLRPIDIPEFFDIDSNSFGQRYKRKLPEDINLIEEYRLIEIRESRLSKWERDEVVFQFNKKYRKI